MIPAPQRPPRVFRADEILSGRVVLDGYPLRYIVVAPPVSSVIGAGLGGRSGTNAMLDLVLTAVEFLEGRGWQVVSIDQGGSVACLRRTAPQ